MKSIDRISELEKAQIEHRFKPIENKHNSHSQEDPLEILKLRYAKGEITKEEYEQMKKDLED